MKKLFFFCLLAIVVSSCKLGEYIPYSQNNFGVQTTVVLDKANFRIVRHVEAVIELDCRKTELSDIQSSAYAQLLRKADLTGSQTLINVVIEEIQEEGGMSLAIFNRKQYIAARGTVIEFIE